MKHLQRIREADRVSFTSMLLTIGLLLSFSAIALPVAAQTDSDIVGEYSVSLTLDDIPTSIGGADGYIGRFRIAFNPDGTYEIDRLDVGQVVSGTYTQSGSQLTITDESGLLSCSNATASTIPDKNTATGKYELTEDGTATTFVEVDDECSGRVLLLTTRPLTVFVACTTVPLVASAPGQPDATPEPEDTAEPGAESNPALEILTPQAESEDAGASSDTEDVEAVSSAIDALLQQMTACWATRAPENWLPLLSNEFRTSLEGDDPEGFRETLTSAMAVPILWERAGDLTIDSDTEASAIVRSTIGAEEDFQRFTFVFEDGEWRWNG